MDVGDGTNEVVGGGEGATAVAGWSRRYTTWPEETRRPLLPVAARPIGVEREVERSPGLRSATGIGRAVARDRRHRAVGINPDDVVAERHVHIADRIDR